MRNWKNICLALITLLVSSTVMAQDKLTDNSDAGDIMRGSGKIYVVVAVVVTILAGLFFYVARLDRKISKMEKGEF